MRWLYHLVPRREAVTPCAPRSLADEGFVHTSYRDEVLESARLHFGPSADLIVLQIDPRRIDAPVDYATTPRGIMPHIRGAIPEDAIAATHELSELGRCPDRVVGTRFAFVAFEGMTLLDLVGVFDPLSRIASMGFDASSTCTIVSADEVQVWSTRGATMSVEAVRPPLDAFDVVVVAGGQGTRKLETDAKVIAWLASYPENRVLASVCTGALLLGAAGRLRGRKATTHHRHLERLPEFGATAVSARLIDAWPIITAGGVTCGLDLGLHLVRMLEGAEVASEIATQMQLHEEYVS